jgi:protein-disulfide isomerase
MNFRINTLLLITLLFFLACSDSSDQEKSNNATLSEDKSSTDITDKDAVLAPGIEQVKPVITNQEDNASQERGFSVAPGDMVQGNVHSPVVVVEYFAPTCPHCVGYHKNTFPEIFKKYIKTNEIAYVTREFIANKQDLDASILSRCKGDVGNYLKFIDVLLSQQDNWAYSKNYREILTNIGSLGGVGPEEYSKCLNDESLVKTLMENTQLVYKIPGFVGTPCFFINGFQFKNSYTVEELSKEIDKYIKASQQNE